MKITCSRDHWTMSSVTDAPHWHFSNLTDESILWDQTRMNSKPREQAVHWFVARDGSERSTCWAFSCCNCRSSRSSLRQLGSAEREREREKRQQADDLVRKSDTRVQQEADESDDAWVRASETIYWVCEKMTRWTLDSLWRKMKVKL